MEKITFKVDNLQTWSKKRDAILARLHNRWRHQRSLSTSWIITDLALCNDDAGWAINIHDVYGLDWWRHRLCKCLDFFGTT